MCNIQTRIYIFYRQESKFYRPESIFYRPEFCILQIEHKPEDEDK